MIRPILKYGESPLHERAAPVDAITPEIDRLVDDMVETMYAAPGIGLAAPQVGVTQRIFVVDLSLGRDANGLIIVVNPEFVDPRRDAARRRGLPERARIQRHGGAAVACGHQRP